MIRRKNNSCVNNSIENKVEMNEVKENIVQNEPQRGESEVDIESKEIYLTLDDINTSLKVFGELKNGYKLRVENKHLAEDNSYITSLSRYAYGHNRDQLIEYLEDLLIEIELNVEIILSEIRNKVNVEKNVCKLDNLIRNLSVFLHNYENMRDMYKGDSVAYSKFGNNKYNFDTFLHSFFKNVTTYSI